MVERGAYVSLPVNLWLPAGTARVGGAFAVLLVVLLAVSGCRSGPRPTPSDGLPVSAYSWHQVVFDSEMIELKKSLQEWSALGGSSVVVDVSMFADISEIGDATEREAAKRALMENLRAIMEEAAEWELAVEVLAGNPDWFTPERAYVVTVILDALNEFNEWSPMPVRRFEMDVEPWSAGIDGWDRAAFLEGLGEAVGHAEGLASAPGLAVSVPYWFDVQPPVPVEGLESSSSLFDQVVQLLSPNRGSSVTVMDYRDRLQGEGGLLASVEGEFSAIAGTDVGIRVAVDLMQESEPGSSLHGASWRELSEMLGELEATYGSRGLEGFALNDLQAAIASGRE